MKPLVVLTRILCVGLFWSLFFIEGVRVIMLRNWHFDMFQTSHWHHAWNLWLSGWVISTPKEWAFILIVLTFIPLWLSGWAALSLIKWEKYILKAADFPIKMFRRMFFQPVKIMAHSGAYKNVQKKKSYKEIRPRSLRLPLDDRPEPENTSKLIATPSRAKTLTPAVAASRAPLMKNTTPKEPEPKEFNHSLFQMDSSSDDDFDFNIDDFDFEKASTPSEEEHQPDSKPSLPQKKDNFNNQKQPQTRDREASRGPKNRDSSLPAQRKNSQASPKGSGNSVLDVIKQHGYETLNGLTIKNNLIDFAAVSQNQIVLCLIDKETGDWLADEERFNDEEPLWFSESSHRISPVRKIDIARKVLEETLASQNLNFTVKAFVIVSIGNIINAEDMIDIWDDLKVSVTRIDRGTPKEIPLFARTLPEAGAPISKNDFEKLKKLIRSIA